MRRLTLLCLVGFILAASWSEGGTVPLAKREIKTTPRPFSIWSPLESKDGFPTVPKTGNANQVRNSSAPTTPLLIGFWNPLESKDGFPTVPTTGNASQAEQT